MNTEKRALQLTKFNCRPPNKTYGYLVVLHNKLMEGHEVGVSTKDVESFKWRYHYANGVKIDLELIEGNLYKIKLI